MPDWEWPYRYRGQGQEEGQDPYARERPLRQQLQSLQDAKRQNLPTYEQHTPGDDDSLGFRRLPSGQYLPSGSFKKGGKVKKTGVYKLHKGEKVLSAKRVKDQETRDKALLQKTRYRRRG